MKNLKNYLDLEFFLNTLYIHKNYRLKDKQTLNCVNLFYVFPLIIKLGTFRFDLKTLQIGNIISASFRLFENHLGKIKKNTTTTNNNNKRQ